MEITIADKIYTFKFGFKFLTEINKEHAKTENGVEVKMGLLNALSNLMIGDVETLVNVLVKANATENPRLTEKVIEELFNDNDVDTIFELVFDGLEKSGFTRKMTRMVRKSVDEAK